MAGALLEGIIANFNLQLRLYQEMKEESRQQLKALKNSPGILDLNPILDRRRRLLADLEELNAVNRKMQKEVLHKLDLKEFTLSQLKGCLKNDELTPLEELIKKLGLLLQEITVIDDDNQCLMARRMIPGVEKERPAAHHQEASRAYEKAREQKKDKGLKTE